MVYRACTASFAGTVPPGGGRGTSEERTVVVGGGQSEGDGICGRHYRIFRLLFLPGGVLEDYAARILWMEEHTCEAAKIAENGRKYIEENFDLEKKYGELVRVWDKM